MIKHCSSNPQIFSSNRNVWPFGLVAKHCSSNMFLQKCFWSNASKCHMALIQNVMGYSIAGPVIKLANENSKSSYITSVLPCSLTVNYNSILQNDDAFSLIYSFWDKLILTWTQRPRKTTRESQNWNIRKSWFMFSKLWCFPTTPSFLKVSVWVFWSTLITL